MWFYVKDGQQIGPVPEDTIVELIRKGEITKETNVWKDGFQEWKKLEDTELVKYLTTTQPSYIPPPPPPPPPYMQPPLQSSLPPPPPPHTYNNIENVKGNITTSDQSNKTLEIVLIVIAAILVAVVASLVDYVFAKHKTSKSNHESGYRSQSPAVVNQPPTAQIPRAQYPQPSNHSTSQTVNDIAAIDLVIENYYSNIPANLRVSYEQLSPERRAEMPYDSWAYGYDTTLYDRIKSIKILELTPDYAKVFVTFRSRDIGDNGGTVVKNWEGTWTLVKENGKWYLDRSHIRLVNAYSEKPLN